MKNYPKKLKALLELESKEVVLKLPKDTIWDLAVTYQKAHQAAMKGHKLTLSEIATLIISQGIEATKADIKGFKNQIK